MSDAINRTTEAICDKWRNVSMERWCEIWRPPPLPVANSKYLVELYGIVQGNDNYLCYSSQCPDDVIDPRLLPSTTPDGSTEIITPFSPIEESVAKGDVGTTLGILFAILFVALILGIVGYLYYRKKHRMARTGTLPIAEYKNTNYLENKALNGQCWNPQLNVTDDPKETYTKTQPNHYGTLPNGSAANSGAYLNNHNSVNNGNSSEKVEPQTEFNMISMSENSNIDNEMEGYFNKNFDGMNDLPSPSPSANSNTPLVRGEDGVDGAFATSPKRNSSLRENVLPNVPTVNKAEGESNGNIRRHSSVLDNGGQSRNSDYDDKTDTNVSPKKKKRKYLNRKSAPSEYNTNDAFVGINNRKSM